MIKDFKILAFSQNAHLIKLLDNISILDIVKTYEDLEKNIKQNEYHFIFVDFVLLELYDKKKEIKDYVYMNHLLLKIKDLSKQKSILVLFGNIEVFDYFNKNKAIDEVLTNPFAPHLAERRIRMLYNKRFWNQNNQFDSNFNFSEEIEVLFNEVQIYLNRLQMYYCNALESTESNKKIPVSFIINTNKIELFLQISLLMNSSNLCENFFTDLILKCKEILDLYDINLQINYNENFTFSDLSFINKKSFFLILVFLMLSSITENSNIFDISRKENIITIETDMVNLFENNIYSNIILKKIIDKNPNISSINSNILIKIVED